MTKGIRTEILKTVSLSTLLPHESEMWIVTQKYRREIETTETRILRQILYKALMDIVINDTYREN